MPELPEVETTRRGIAPALLKKKIQRLKIWETRFRWPVDPAIAEQIEGQTLRAIERRGKYLLFRLDSGYFAIHLGMSGSLRLASPSRARQKHDHIEFVFSARRSLRFCDPRRFGCLLWLGDQPQQHRLLQHLGVEPLSAEFTGEYLHALSRNKRVAIKQLIMDHRVVVGVGNIYASEALFLSGIRPTKAAGRLSRRHCEKLVEAIVAVLDSAIAQGGTTLKDFVGGDGKPGYFQQTLAVYGRQGKPCINCGKIIKKRQLGQRSTFYCPSCQR